MSNVAMAHPTAAELRGIIMNINYLNMYILIVRVNR
jgi:hypothetical protein